MKMLMIRFAFIIFLFCLSGCSLLSPKAEYIPDNKVLKNAAIGVPYFYKINILGGKVIGPNKSEGNIGLVEPDNSGIFLRSCQLSELETKDMKPKDSNNYNCVEVYGTPTRTGVIKINISGGMYGHMFAPSSEFSKDYILTVIEP